MKHVMAFMILMLGSAPVYAADVSVDANQAKLEINGAVCAYCAYGMQKGLSKMDCVDTSQGHKGVESDIENQIITIYLKKGKKVDLREMSEKIRKSGYEPRTFHLRVKGAVAVEDNRSFLMSVDQERLFELQGAEVQKLSNQKTYDLQLRIDEEAIEAFDDNTLPLAQVNSVIGGE